MKSSRITGIRAVALAAAQMADNPCFNHAHCCIAFSYAYPMATQTITTDTYKLFPSPRNVHREIFVHEVFVPYPYALIDMPSFYLKGKHSLFAACRLADMKMGQLVTFEQESDVAIFNSKFVPE
jgi:hypothetical protein